MIMIVVTISTGVVDSPTPPPPSLLETTYCTNTMLKGSIYISDFQFLFVLKGNGWLVSYLP